MEIKHDNIVYITNISPLGGVETFAYEMVKKYKNTDIAVVCKKIADNQMERLLKICPVYIHTNEKIKCKTIIINFDNSILDYLDYSEGKPLICEVIHADYTNSHYECYPVIDKRVDRWIGITEHVCKTFSEMFGVETELGYNPLNIEAEEYKKPLILLSATRLLKIKGGWRMRLLAEALDRAKINYLWFIFSNDKLLIDEAANKDDEDNEYYNPHVIYQEPSMNIRQYINIADYGIQLSSSEALSYTINEFLYMNKPVIVTPLPYLEEIGFKNNENGYILNFDCSNIEEIVNKIKNIPKFNFKRLEDKYDTIIKLDSKSRWEEMRNMKYRVRATSKYIQNGFKDNELGRIPKEGEEWDTSFDRFQHLLSKGYVKYVSTIPEEEDKILKVDKIVDPETLVENFEAYEEKQEGKITFKESKEDRIKNLKKLKKAELIKEAESLGYTTDDTMTKDTLIRMIVEK